MSIQLSKKRAGVLSLTAALLIVAGALLAPVASARIIFNTIDSTARISDNGRQITLTGPVTCDGGQRLDLRVTVTQRSTGAVAEGRAEITCEGGQQHWEVRASTQGAKTFVAGPAVATALATTFRAFDRDESLSVAVLTGGGGAFCAGADLKAMASGRRRWMVKASQS